jgi:hypothetical protein
MAGDWTGEQDLGKVDGGEAAAEGVKTGSLGQAVGDGASDGGSRRWSAVVFRPRQKVWTDSGNVNWFVQWIVCSPFS